MSRLPEAAPAEMRRALLVNLVMIDLDRRWQAAHTRVSLRASSHGEETVDGESTGTLPIRPLLEDYVRRFPEFGACHQLPDELVACEYRARHRWGDRPSHNEYVKRFGTSRTALVGRLSKIDAELAPPAKPKLAAAKVGPPGSGWSGALQVRCPHCHTPVELSDDMPASDIGCPTCGSAFNLVGEQALTLQTVGGTRHRRRTIGHFELTEQLGSGQFGVVWKARDTKLDRTVAIKTPHKGQLNHEETEKVLREARAAAQLRHPNIVSVHEVGLDGDLLYTVSEYIEGLSLHDWLTGQRLTYRESAELCAKIAEAMHFAHEHGVIHRDLKPSNILMGRDGEPYVMDFGLAKRETGEVTMTMEGQVMGTPAYMSPEQARGEGHTADRRTDVYSLGVLLFELLTGERPFRGNMRMMIKQVLEDEPPRPRKFESRVPRDLETICLKCLEKDPKRRYGTARELAAELHRYLAGEPIEARPISTTGRAWRWCERNPVVAGLTATAVLLLAAVAVVGLVGYVQTTLALGVARSREFDARVARETSEHERDNARQARLVAETTVIDMYTALGLIAAERGDPQEAVLWFANAAAQTEHDPDREIANRIRLQTWSREFPVPVRAFQHRGHQIREISFDPSGRYLLAHDHTLGSTVWSLEEERPVALLPDGQVATAAAWSPGGELLAIATPDRYVEICRFPSGERLYRLSAQGSVSAQERSGPLSHQEPIHSLAFSDDAHYLAIGSDTLWVWDSEETQFALSDSDFPGNVVQLAFNSDSSQLAATSTDQLAFVYALHSKQREGNPLFGPVTCDSNLRPVFVPDDTVLLGNWDSGEVAWRDAESGAVTRTTPLGGPKTIVPCRSRDAVIMTGFMAVRLYSALDGQGIGDFVGHGDFVCDAALSPDETRLVTVSSDRTARVWDVESRDLAAPQMAHQDDVHCAAFSADDRHFATAQRDGLIRVWSLPEPRDELLIRSDEHGYLSWVTSADGRHCAEAGFGVYRHQTTTRVHDLATGKPEGPILQVKGLVNGAAFIPDTTCLVTLSSLPEHSDQQSPDQIQWDQQPGWVIFWDWRSGDRLFDPLVTPTEPLAAACTPDGKLLIVICAGGDIVVVDPASGRLTAQLEHGDVVQSPSAGNPKRRILLSPTGRFFATMLGQTIRLWETSTRRLLHTMRHGELRRVADLPFDERRLAATDADFSFDERWLVTSDLSGAAYVWDLETGKRATEPLIHPNRVFSAEFSPDARYILTACRNGTALLWDWREGRTVCPALEHEGGQVYDARFVPGGRWLMTLGNHFVRTWDTRTGTLVAPRRRCEGCFDLHFPPRQGHAMIAAAKGAHILDLDDCDESNLPVLNPEGLRSLGEILSGRRVQGGGSVKLTSRQWLERWQSFREGNPEYHHFAVDAHEHQATSETTYQERETLRRHADVVAPDHSANKDVLDASAWCDRGRAERERGDLDKAIAAFTKAIEMKPDYYEAFLQRGHTFRDSLNEVDEAIPDYTRAVKIRPDGFRAYAERAEAYFRLERFDKAVADYAKAIELNPEHDRLYNMRAQAYGRLGQLNEAVADLSKAIELTSNDLYHRRRRAELLLKLRRFEEALADCMAAIKLTPDWDHLYYLRGKAYAGMGQYDNAVADLTTAIEMTDNYHFFYSRRASFHIAMKEYGEAAADWAKVVELKPSDSIPWLEAATLLVLANDSEVYRSHCRGMIEQFRDAEDGHILEQTCKACLLIPHCLEVSELPIAKLDAALQANSAPDELVGWGMCTRALVAYRSGQYDTALEAIGRSQQTDTWTGARGLQALGLVLQAVALHQRDRPEDARQPLAEATRLVREQTRNLYDGELIAGWHDWLIAEILCREAAQLIAEPTKQPAPEPNTASDPKTE